jgi:hypothetical protein
MSLLSIASYDSLDYDGSIRLRLRSSLYTSYIRGAPATKYTFSKNINIVMCLSIRCLETDFYIVARVNFHENVFTEPLPSNDNIISAS